MANDSPEVSAEPVEVANAPEVAAQPVEVANDAQDVATQAVEESNEPVEVAARPVEESEVAAQSVDPTSHPKQTLTQDEVANYTLKQLQAVCVQHDLPARGTKADLRQRLQQANIIV